MNLKKIYNNFKTVIDYFNDSVELVFMKHTHEFTENWIKMDDK